MFTANLTYAICDIVKYYFINGFQKYAPGKE